MFAECTENSKEQRHCILFRLLKGSYSVVFFFYGLIGKLSLNDPLLLLTIWTLLAYGLTGSHKNDVFVLCLSLFILSVKIPECLINSLINSFPVKTCR